jgi:hypothetical protein
MTGKGLLSIRSGGISQRALSKARRKEKAFREERKSGRSDPPVRTEVGLLIFISSFLGILRLERIFRAR